MKISQRKLKQIIKEEVHRALEEDLALLPIRGADKLSEACVDRWPGQCKAAAVATTRAEKRRQLQAKQKAHPCYPWKNRANLKCRKYLPMQICRASGGRAAPWWCASTSKEAQKMAQGYVALARQRQDRRSAKGYAESTMSPIDFFIPYSGAGQAAARYGLTAVGRAATSALGMRGKDAVRALMSLFGRGASAKISPAMVGRETARAGASG